MLVSVMLYSKRGRVSQRAAGIDPDPLFKMVNNGCAGYKTASVCRLFSSTSRHHRVKRGQIPSSWRSSSMVVSAHCNAGNSQLSHLGYLAGKIFHRSGIRQMGTTASFGRMPGHG